MKIILKPLEIENTVDIEPLGKLLTEKEGIWILHGKAKVGKTALMYKLMHWWLLQGYITPIYYPFSGVKSYHHWEMQMNKLCNDDEILKQISDTKRVITQMEKGGSLQKFTRIILLMFFSIKMNKQIEKRLIIIEGIELLINEIPELAQTLFLMLSKISKENEMIVLLSCRSKIKIEGYTDTIIQNGGSSLPFKFIHLERPAFMGDDIKEFGDSMLTIED